MEDIRRTVGTGKLYVGFSGGEDSSLVALLAKEALGRDRVRLVTIDWGAFTYEKSRRIVREFSKEHDLQHIFVKAEEEQKKVWRFGPSCNSCTKFVKVPMLRKVAGKDLVATGANSYDTWGRTGLRVFGGVYAPLSGLDKAQIRALLRLYGVEVERIGESEEREGCKLKNLLKPLINPDFHGRAVALSNETLISILEEYGFKAKSASVKIVGPLSRNTAVVVLDPKPPDVVVDELKRELSKLDVLDEVVFAWDVSEVVVVASKPIYRNSSARENVKRTIGIPGSYRWVESRNTRLRTFQVVEVIR